MLAVASWLSQSHTQNSSGPLQPIFVAKGVRAKTAVISQAARQGLAVLMASAVVVLRHKTSTLRRIHNFISIDFKFAVGDNVREVTNPAKFGSDPMSGRDARWGQHKRVLDFFLSFFVFYSSTELYSPYP